MKPWVKYGVIAILSLLGVVFAMVWLLTTPGGARLLMGTVSRWTSVKIDAQKITGRLADELRMEGISVGWQNGEVQMDQVHLRWSPASLLSGRIAFSDLDLGRVEIRDDRPEKNIPPDLTLPKVHGLLAWLFVEIRSFRLKELIYRRLNRNPLSLENLSANLSLHRGRLEVRQLVFDTSFGHGETKGELDLLKPVLNCDFRYSSKETIIGLDIFVVSLRLLPGRGPEQVTGTLALVGKSALVEGVQLRGKVGLTSNQINLRDFLLSQTGRPGTVTIDGSVSFPQRDPLARLDLKLKDVDLSKELLLGARLSGLVSVEGKPSDYRGQLRVENSDETRRVGGLSGIFQGDLDHVNVSQLDGTLLGGTLKGRFEASWARGISLSGQLQGRELDSSRITPDWPGKINLNMEGRFYGPGSTPSDGRLEVSLLDSHLRGKALSGRVDVQLNQGVLQLKKADLHGRGFDLSAQGVLQDRLDFDARISDLSGLIPGTQGSFNGKGWVRRRENRVAGVVAGQGKDLLINHLRVASLDVSARLADEDRATIDLKARAKALVFDSFQMDSVSLNIKGRVERHSIEIRASWSDGGLQGLLEGGYAKESWEGKIVRFLGSYPRGRPWTMDSPASLWLSAGSLKMAPFLISGQADERVRISADLAFSPIRGSLEAEWEDFDLSRIEPWVNRPNLSGRSTGRLRNEWLEKGGIRLNASLNMTGAIRDASLNLERVRGRVTLAWGEKGLDASYAAELADAGEFQGQLSSPQPGRFALPEQVRIEAFWKAVDLGLFKHWFPNEFYAEGQASGHLSGQWLKGGRWNTTGDLNVSQGTVRWRTQEGPMHAPLERADFDWSWSEGDLQGKFSVSLSEYGEVEGSLRLPVAARHPLAISKTGPVAVSLHGQVEGKRVLPVLFPKVIGESWGGLALDFRVRGSWEKPRMEGSLQLKKAGVRLIGESSPPPVKDSLRKPPSGQRVVEPLNLEVPRGRATISWSDKGLLVGYALELGGGGKLQGHFSSSQSARLAFPEKGKLNAAFEGIQLDFLRRWLPSSLSFNGLVSGKVVGEWFEEQRLTVKGGLKVLQGALDWEGGKGALSARLPTAELHLDWSGEELKGGLSVALEKHGTLKGDFKLPLPARLPVRFHARGPIQAALQGEMEEKGLLTALFPELIQESHGKLNLDMVASGTWEKIRWEGRLKLAGAGAYLPQNGIHLKDLRFEAKIRDEEIQMTSFRIESGPGYMEGNATASIKDWKISRLHGTLRGDRFQILYLPELQVLCTPRIEFDGVLERLKIRGEIQLPEISVLGHQAKGVVRPSPDVVVVDRKELPKQEPAFPLDAEVRILLGDKVFVKTKGIDARLIGEIALRAAPLRQLVATGEIQVAQGSYTIYGQKLDITRGHLRFNGPIDNPSLDILALRKIKGATRWEEQMREVQAGVVVTGTIQSPLIRLYSQPALPEKDILSYIVLGEPVSSIEGEDKTATLISAARALFSLGEAALTQGQSSNQLGLDKLDIRTTPLDSRGSPDSAGSTGSGSISRSLVTVGMYLDPRLYIGIGGSPFTNSYQIIFRYGLTKRFELETKAGTESGANIYFRIEFE